MQAGGGEEGKKGRLARARLSFCERKHISTTHMFPFIRHRLP